MVSVDACYEIALALTREAGEIIKNAIYKNKHVETKLNYADLVTETDKEVEDFLFKGLKLKFPDHRFIGEESASAEGKCDFSDVPTWIIDPVDGTMNFVHGFPNTAISIALTINKKVVLGIIYNPILDRMFTALKGKGAFCDGKKLQASEVTDLSKALVFIELGNNRDPEVMEQVLSNFSTIARKVHGVRAMGSAALNMCEVASGHADAYFEYTIHCWDIAAGSLIVEEAGGVVIDPEGGPLDLMSRRVLCASSSSLADTLSKELKHIQMPKD